MAEWVLGNAGDSDIGQGDFGAVGGGKFLPLGSVAEGGAVSSGGGSDSFPPTIESIIPSPNGPLGASHDAGRLQPVSFDVLDPIPGIRLVLVTVKYKKDLHTMLVFDGVLFKFPFLGTSTVSSIPGGMHLSILPNGGWIDDIEEFRVHAIDGNGNLMP